MLRVVKEVITTEIAGSGHHQPARQNIAFKTEKLHQSLNQPGVLLARAQNWKLKNISMTTLRPDIVMELEKNKASGPAGTDCFLEDWMEEAFENKRAKYEDLAGKCQNGIGDLVQPHCGEVQKICEPITHQGPQDALSEGTAHQESCEEHRDIAEKASRWLWIKRSNPWITLATQIQARAGSALPG